MGREECKGEVGSLGGAHVLFTGTTHVDGEHLTREELSDEVRDLGAVPIVGTRNKRVTVLVQGDLLRSNVSDPVAVRSKNAVFVDEQRMLGNHICIIDDYGLSSLLRGGSAPCLKSRVVRGDLVELAPTEVDSRPKPLAAAHLDVSASAEDLLRRLIGHALETVSGRMNRILAVADGTAIVQTGRSPGGQPVPVVWIQSALEKLLADGQVTIDPESVGYRSAFVGAVLRTLPGAVMDGSPPVIRIEREARIDFRASSDPVRSSKD